MNVQGYQKDDDDGFESDYKNACSGSLFHASMGRNLRVIFKNDLVFSARWLYSSINTRAAPLVRKDDVHQGRVFFCLKFLVAFGRLNDVISTAI